MEGETTPLLHFKTKRERMTEKNQEKTQIASRARRALGPVEGIITIVIVGALLAIAPFVIGELQLGLNTSGLPTAAQNAVGTVFTQIYNALGILPLVLIIIALVIILSAVFLLVPRRGGGMVQGGGEAV